MATSSMPSVAFAADLFSDGSAVEFATEEADVFTEEAAAPAEEAAVFTEEADTDDNALQAESDAWQVDPSTIVFYYNSKEKPDFTVVYKEKHVENGELKYRAKETTATTKETTEATCEAAPTLVMTVTIDDQTFVSEKFVTGKKLGHDYKEIKRQTITAPTHLEEGLAHVWYECSRGDKCDGKRTYDTDVVLPAQEHEWATEVTYEATKKADLPANVTTSNIVVDEKGKVVLDEEGLPKLVDATKDGYYDTVYYCVKNDGGEKDRKHKVRYAQKGVYAVIEKQEGIASDLVGTRYQIDDPTVTFPLDEAGIELTDCSKAGSYTVAYYQREGKRISEETIVVNPHHLEQWVTIEFKTKDDEKQCEILKDDYGKVTGVKNKSCYLPITYYEVVHCAARGCKNDPCDQDKNGENYTCHYQNLKEVSRVEKVAEPAGEHAINTTIKNEIAAKVKAGVTFEELQELAKVTANYIRVSNDTSTCTEDGTATVEYLCMVCKSVVKTETVKVVKKGHIKLAPVKENYVAPTCTSEGSYDAVSYCKRCNEVLDKRVAVRIPRIAHTNEIKVYQDENGKDIGVDDKYKEDNLAVEFIGELVVDKKGQLQNYAGTKKDVSEIIKNNYGKDYYVTADAYTLCTVCGEHKVVVANPTVITVDSVTKQSKECKPGSITLTTTYTKKTGEKVSTTETFDYYSTIEEYRGRKTHTPGEPVKENIIEATATENGSYDEVVYCTVCGTEISRKNVVVNATGEVILPAVTGLKATATGMKRVALSWDAVEGAEGYFIIGFGENRTGSQIAYTTRTSWTDTAADSDAFNFYWVQPFNRNAAGKIVKGELGGYKYALGRVVAATSKVTATATEDGIELNWAAVSGANSYVVMSKTGSADAEFNASVATDTTTYVDTTASSGEVTYYWVYATYKNADGKALAAGKTSPFAWAIAK